ncbi:MAG: extracellular solute-binding protein [Cyanobacteria bacterium KgW148]|nr:extracellular solute-binding protein [Cyanobacteria bacterium KgW148]
MNRRSFTIGLSAITLGGCQLFPSPSLNIEVISGIIPAKLIKEFNQINKSKLTLKISKNYDELTQSFTNSTNTNLIATGDAWLASIFSSLQVIDPKQISNFNLIPDLWRSVGTINSNLYAIPYRWGATVIVYNQKKFAKNNIPPIQTWQDLWHPQLKRKISLPDHDREVIGLCCKRRGLSYNHIPDNDIAQLQEDLDSIDQQTLVYTSNHYVQALVHEDTWAAVGWSGDFLEIVKRYPQLKIIYPQEGTALWFDCWALTQNLPDIASAYQWINYCLEPQNSHLITLLTNGNGITDPQKLLDQAYLDRCEPILPLPQAASLTYEKLWQELRQKP